MPRKLFTSARAPEHLARGYAAHASAYVAKPTDFDDYQRAVRAIDDFYTRVCVPLTATT